jgi:thiosulfate/3-mercaptopyruvate sulfurtransferase
MNDLELPLVIEADQLQPRLQAPGLLIIDLCKPDTYAKAHIPGAIHLDYGKIIDVQKPAMGLLPDEDKLSQVFSLLGLTPDTHVVAYDDEGGGRAARLIWTLDAVGHYKASLLNGGLLAWVNEGHPIEARPCDPIPSHYQAQIIETPVAEKDYILEHLDDPQVALLDSRSIEEYSGEKKFAQRAGHIPGAVNLDWFMVMDRSRNMRLKPQAELRELFEERGISADKTVITYCQSHHRSALTYFALKSLGYPKVKGYPGSWSEWGNDPNTPIES